MLVLHLLLMYLGSDIILIYGQISENKFLFFYQNAQYSKFPQTG